MTREFYEKNKDLAERFAEACRQGWEWAAQNPEETLDIVMDYVEREHISTNRIHQKLMLDEVLSLLKDRESGQREYRLRPDMVKQASDLMLENGMLEMPVTYEDIIDHPHYQSKKRPHMSLHDRAAQFAPFAALTGYGDSIKETERLAEERFSKEYSKDQNSGLNSFS